MFIYRVSFICNWPGVSCISYQFSAENNSVFEDATINPDWESLMISSSVSDFDLDHPAAARPLPPQWKYTTGSQQVVSFTSLLLCECDSTLLWLFSLHPGLPHAEPLDSSLFRMGDTPPRHLLPCSFLQPIHMQLAADNDWIVLHVVWASMKETGSYRSGRQQGWLLTLRAVRRGSEPFSSSAFSARS